MSHHLQSSPTHYELSRLAQGGLVDGLGCSFAQPWPGLSQIERGWSPRQTCNDRMPRMA
jgi:hypothetical protein